MKTILNNVICSDGYNRSILFNPSTQKYNFVPNSLMNLIKTQNDISKWFLDNDLDVINDYIKFLDDERYIMEYDRNLLNNFKPISVDFFSSSFISVVEILLTDDFFDFQVYSGILNQSLCKNVVVEFKGDQINILFEFLIFLREESFVNNIFIKLDYNLYYENIIDDILDVNLCVFTVKFFNSNFNKFIKKDSGGYYTIFFEMPNNFRQLRFDFSLKIISEAKLFNVFHNRRIYIRGNIFFYFKNDIKGYDIKEFDINNLNDIEVWKIPKSEIQICLDCEFKLFCSDKRLPQKHENKWLYLSECNYNPYISKWKDEKGYRTLAECGVISNEEGFSIDHEKIAEINKELWEEDDDNV